MYIHKSLLKYACLLKCLIFVEWTIMIIFDLILCCDASVISLWYLILFWFIWWCLWWNMLLFSPIWANLCTPPPPPRMMFWHWPDVLQSRDDGSRRELHCACIDGGILACLDRSSFNILPFATKISVATHLWMSFCLVLIRIRSPCLFHISYILTFGQ